MAAQTLERARQTRQYAENLIGPNNRSYLDTQRQVAKDIYNTNWETIQNNFKNLKDKLETQRVQSNRDFNNGLVGVADNSYNRFSNQSADLVNRGLTSSGIGNRVIQDDTTAKGTAVQSLLSKLGGDVTAQMEALKQGGEKIAAKERELNAGLGNTMGDIGNADLSNQLKYNKGAAGIAAGKDERDTANEMAALQRAANAAASSRGKSKEDKDLEEYYKNKIISNILNGYDLDTGEKLDYNDKQKENALRVLFDLNGGAAVEGYNKNIKATENYNNTIKDYEDKIKKYGSDNGKMNLKDYEKVYGNATKEQLFLDTLLKNGEDKLFDGTGDSKKLVDYLNQQYNSQGKNTLGTISDQEAMNLLSKIVSPTSGNIQYKDFVNQNPLSVNNVNNSNLSLQDLVDTYRQYKSGETPLLGQQFMNAINSRPDVAKYQNELSNYRNQGITYADLAKILYGSR